MIDDDVSVVLHQEKRTGIAVRCRSPNPIAGDIVHNEIAIHLHGELPDVAATGVTRPLRSTSHPIQHEIAVLSHDQLVLTIGRYDGSASRQTIAGAQPR